jgi:competence protein ComGC
MKRRKGFTLIEMAIVIFIISLLMLLILPNLNQQRKNAQKIHAEAMVSTVQTQVDLYQNEFDDNDITIAELTSAGYLTKNQEKKATDLGIKIYENKVSK